MTFGVRRWPDGNTAQGGQGQDVAGHRCWPVMFSEFHTHTHLTILEDGQHLMVPPNIGIVRIDEPDGDGRCFYPLHTHDGAGILHVEFPRT